MSNVNITFKRLKKAKQKLEREKGKRNKLMANERKKRANRLIQKGALLEKYFDCYSLTPEETEELLKIFSSYVKNNKPHKFVEKGEQEFD